MVQDVIAVDSDNNIICHWDKRACVGEYCPFWVEALTNDGKKAGKCAHGEFYKAQLRNTLKLEKEIDKMMNEQ